MDNHRSMGTVLKQLIGHRVLVFTHGQGGYKDEGVVREVDELCLRLEVGDPGNATKQMTQMYIPITGIRLIRRLD